VRVGHNPLCGDELVLYLDIQNDRIVDVRFQGQGCAIFTASASLMTEALKGKTLDEVGHLLGSMHLLLTGNLSESDQESLGKLQVLKGVKEFPVRVKCAALPWRTLEAAIHPSTDESITTE
jgi:nitrogen fixation protein NifU and related proteins